MRTIQRSIHSLSALTLLLTGAGAASAQIPGGLPQSPLTSPARYSLGAFGTFQQNGLLVKTVVPGSPADQVRIAPGDLLVSLNGVAATNQLVMTKALDESRGRAVIVLRKAPRGQLQRVTAVLKLANRGKTGPRYALGVLGQYTRQGMLIQTVIPGSPAATAGLQRGDLLFKIDDSVIRDQDDFRKALRDSGGAVVLLFRSQLARQVVERKVRLAEDTTTQTLRLGVVGDFRPEGMFITLVGRGTPAERAGLERGDFLIKIDNVAIRSLDDLDSAVEDSGGLATVLVRKAGTRRLKKIEIDLRTDRRRRR